VAVYGREGRCIAAVAFDCARWLPTYAEHIAAGAPFPPETGGVDAGPFAVLPPAFPEPAEPTSPEKDAA